MRFIFAFLREEHASLCVAASLSWGRVTTMPDAPPLTKDQRRCVKRRRESAW